MIRLALLLGLSALAALGWLSWRFLGAWTFLAVPVAAWLFFKLAGGWIFRRLMMIPFKAKGAPLRNAAVTVHSVLPATPPADEDMEKGETLEVGQEPEPLRWFQVEATIAPADGGEGPFRLWEPGSIRLGSPEADPADESGNDGPCTVHRVEIHGEGGFVPDEGMKYEGPQRLRLLLGVRNGTYRLSFTYYLEKFGEVRLAG